MDRWSQLSLKDKSDLMSLYIQNGISSLEEIKKHYNSFATGGQMNTDGPDDPPDAISGADRVVPNTTLDKTQRNWLQRWYNNRQEQLANNMDASSGSIAGNIGSSFVNPNKYLRRSFEFADNVPILDRRQYNSQELATIAEQTNTYETIKDYQYRQSGEQGFFTHLYGKNPVIGITPLGDETTPLHEYIHAMQHAPYTVYGKQVDAVRDYQKDKGLSSKDYLDKPDEIYSRLMQLRYKNKVNPKHKWTKKEIQDFKKNATDFNILNRYDDDFLLYLFNDVAQNTSSSQDTPHYAALGGHLFKDGGTDDDIAFTRTLVPVNIVEDAPEGVQIARRMLSYDKPYRNFMKAQDMDLYHRVKSTIFPIDCVNTATRAITQDSTIGANRSLFDNPEKYGYVRVDPDSIHAGDLVQYATYNSNWRPYHAGIVVKVPDEGVEIKSANGSGEMNPKRIYDNRVYPNAYDTLMYYRYIGK